MAHQVAPVRVVFGPFWEVEALRWALWWHRLHGLQAVLVHFGRSKPCGGPSGGTGCMGCRLYWFILGAETVRWPFWWRCLHWLEAALIRWHQSQREILPRRVLQMMIITIKSSDENHPHDQRYHDRHHDHDRVAHEDDQKIFPYNHHMMELVIMMMIINVDHDHDNNHLITIVMMIDPFS